jgi:hypothetical protein
MKTIKTQIKTIMVLLAFVLSTNIYAQKDTKKSGIFVRVYNLDGKKINKGHIAFVGDTLLGLKRNGKYTEINFKEIASIKTKRSAGHNVLIGSAIGATTGAILGAATADPGAWIYNYTAGEGAAAGALMGAAAGAAVGGISIAFKNPETYIINGSLENWSFFQKRMQK